MGNIIMCGRERSFSTKHLNALIRLRLLIVLGFLIAGSTAQSQVLIAQEGFNNTTSIFTVTGGVYYTGVTGGGVKPPGANKFSEGTASYGVKNGTAVLTSAIINTGSFGNNSVSFRLSAHGNGMGNGVDNLDFVRVEVSTDGGTNYTQYIQIIGDANSSYWDFDAAGIASTNYPTAVNLVSPYGNVSSPAFSGLNTGYGTVVINDIPTTTSLRVRITLFNNKNQKDWLVDDFRVTGYNLPQVSSFTGNEYCSGGTGMLTLTTNSGTGPFTVVYNDGSSNQTINNISSGVPFNATPNPASTTNYTLVSVTDVNNATRYTGFSDGNATITVNMPPLVSAGSPFTKSCIQNINGALIGESPEAGFSYSWSPSSGLSAGNVSNPHADPTTTTTYTVTKTNDLTGCFSSASVTVTVDNDPLPVDAGQPFTKTCVLNANGAVIGESNDPAATYSWSPSIGLSSSTVSNPLANPASTTLYTLTKTRISNGCTSAASVLVTVDTELPLANAGNDFTITCIENVTGALIGEVAEANSSYSWSPTTGLSDASVSEPLALPSATTNYTLTRTNTINGCSSTDQVTVTVSNDIPVVDAGSPFTKTCTSNINGAMIGEVADPSATYSWSPSVGLSTSSVSNPVADPLETTTYTVIKTIVATGCEASASVTVTVDQEPPAAAITNNTGATELTCSLTSINVTASGGISYSWDGGAAGSTDADRIFTSPGTYTVTVTASNGCSDTESIIITQDITDPVAILNNNTGATEITCTLPSISVTASGGVSYSWDGGTAGATDADRVFSSPGTYTVTVTSANGCTDTESITITQSSDIPVALITNNTGTTELTCSITEINVAASGGVTYSWDGGTAGATDADRTFTTPGTYTVTVTAANGCTDTESITISQNIIDPVATIENNTGTTELNCTINSISVTAEGGQSYSWDGGTPGATDADRNFITPGTYTVTVTTANGCTDTESITITQNIIDPIATITNNSGTTELTCAVTTISASASGAQNYSWDGGTPGVTDADRNFTTPGTFTVTVTAANGCTDTESITITQNIIDPVATITNNTGTTELNCTVTSITVTASGDGTFTWDGGAAGNTNAERIFTSPGTYTVTVTAANGCTDTESITITQNIIDPVATITNNTGATELTCSITEISVTASGGGTYVWDGGTAGAGDADRTFSAPGTYSVTVTTANGCTDTESIIITQNIIDPVATITNNTGTTELTCAVTSISVTATGGGNYVWDGGTPGATDADRTFITPGTYTVTVTAANGCTDTKDIIITQNIVDPVAGINNNSATTELTCAVTSISVSATGGGTYAWDGGTAGATDADRTFTSPGTYTVTVTSANGCSDTESITISQDIVNPVAGVINNTGSTELTCIVSGINVTATGGGSYAWDGGTPGATDADRIFTSPGTYTVTVTASNGCSDTESIIITQDIADPVAGITNNSGAIELTCTVTSISVSATGGVSYSWDGGTAGATDADRLFTSPGLYTVTVTGANGCTDTESITISQNIVDPVSTIVNNTGATELTCAITSINVTATGGGTYSWDGGSAGATDADRLFTSPGTYTVTVISANGCTDTESIIITQSSDIPVAVITNNTGTTALTCTVTSISVTASGGVSYSWDGGNTGGSDADRIFSAPGTYTVTVTASNGCSNMESITITQNIINPVATINNNTGTSELTCSVTSINVTASGGGTFVWDGGTAGTTDADRTFSAPGTYTVTVTAANGCTDSESIIITQNIIDPVAGIINNTGTTELTCSVTSISVTAIGGVSYSWDGGSAGVTDADRVFSSPGTYTVTVTGANGCTDTESIVITQDIDNPVAGISNPSGLTELTCEVSEITLVATGSGSYTWNAGMAGVNPGEWIISGPGTYILTVTSSNGCVDQAQVVITQNIIIPQQPIVDVVHPTCTESTGSITITSPSEPGMQYSNGGPYQSSPVFSGLLPATYEVTALSANGCVSPVATVVINEQPLTPDAPVVTVTDNCDGSSTLVATNYTGTLTWNTGSTANPLYVVTPGYYQVTQTVGPCTSSSSVPVLAQPKTTPPAPTVDVVNNVNGTTTLTAVGYTGTLLWSTGETSSSITVAVNGVYSVTQTVNGCTSLPGYGATSLQVQADPALGAVYIVNNIDAVQNANTLLFSTEYSVRFPVYNLNQLNMVPAGSTTLKVNLGSKFILDPSFVVTSAPLSSYFSWSATTVSGDLIITGVQIADIDADFIGLASFDVLGSSSCASDIKVDWLIDNNSNSVLFSDNDLSNNYSQLQYNLPVTINAIAVNVTCKGANNGTINWTASPGTVIVITNSLNQVVAPPLAPGTYKVTAFGNNDNSGVCSNFVMVTITEPALSLMSNISGTPVSCFGGSNGTATTNVSGGTAPYTYLWNTLPAQTTATATGLSVGTYFVTVTDAKGCTVVSAYTVTQPTALTLPISSTNVSCFNGSNGSVTINPAGGTSPYNYNWQGYPLVNDPVLNGVPSGTYSVIVTDVNGCSASASINVTQPPTPLTSTTNGTNVSCFGNSTGSATVVPVGGTPGYTYVWNTVPEQYTANISGLSSGTYNVTVTDLNGCTSTASYEVTEPIAALNAVATGTDLTCYAAGNGQVDVTVSGGTAPYSYSWNTTPVNTNQSVSGLPAGTYIVTVTDSKGCVTTALKTITQPAVISNTGAFTNVSCSGGNDGTASVFPAGGVAPYSYAWNTTPVQTSQHATGLSAGVYTVMITDAMGCQKSSVFTITAPAPLDMDITSNNVSCNGGADGSATAIATGGTGPYTYVWNTTPVQTNPVATGLVAGLYVVSITDSKGCNYTESFNITEPAPLDAAAIGTNVACNGNSDGTATALVSGGTAPYTYAWNTIPVQNTAVATGLAAGSYSVTVTDSKGCSSQATYTVTEPAEPLASTISGTGISCTGTGNGSATVVVTGGVAPYSYSWNTVPVQTASTATGLLPGVYSVIITDANGCTTSNSYEVLQPAGTLTVALSGNAVDCYSQQTGSVTTSVIGGSAPYSYSWGNLPLETGSSLSNVAAGLYSVLVTDVNGCTAYGEYVVTQPAAALQSSISSLVNNICNGGNTGSIALATTGGTAPYNYLWNTTPVQTGSTANGLTQGNYSVIVSDDNGCTVTVNASITQPAGIYPDITLGSDYTSNFFAAMGSENDIVYNVSEIGGNPATGDTIRIIVPSGYEIEFDNAATGINIGGNNYLLDNSRWKLIQTNSAFVSIVFDPFGNNLPGTLYCGESVRVKVKLRRLTSTRSVFTLSSRLRRADGEVNLSNNLNSIIFTAE